MILMTHQILGRVEIKKAHDKQHASICIGVDLS